MCRKAPRFKRPELLSRRAAARQILMALAGGPDPFTLRQALSTFGEVSRFSRPECWLAVGWLRDHGFFQCVGRRYGKRYLWQLSDQAIRWLDWTGFQWKRAS